MLVVDLVIVLGILVVASRPDGLAITVTAAILAVGAFFYRCTVSLKSRFAPRPDRAAGRARPVHEPKLPSAAPVARSEKAGKSKSWLREQD